MQFVLKMTQKCAKCRHVPSDVAVFTEVRKSQLIFCPKKAGDVDVDVAGSLGYFAREPVLSAPKGDLQCAISQRKVAALAAARAADAALDKVG